MTAQPSPRPRWFGLFSDGPTGLVTEQDQQEARARAERRREQQRRVASLRDLWPGVNLDVDYERYPPLVTIALPDLDNIAEEYSRGRG